MGIRMRVNAAQFYKRCALKYRAAEGRNRRQHGASIRAPENRSAARFLGKRSGRRSERGGKQSAPSAMAPWRDERTAGFPLDLDNFFRQLERNCENLIPQAAACRGTREPHFLYLLPHHHGVFAVAVVAGANVLADIAVAQVQQHGVGIGDAHFQKDAAHPQLPRALF